MGSLKEAAEIIVKDCLAVEAGEEVLIIVDRLREEIGESIYQAAKEREAEVILSKILMRDNHGVEPPTTLAQAMKEAEVVIMPTTKSLSHTTARVEACKTGTRAVTLPGITAEMMKRTLNADYKKIKARSEKLVQKLNAAQKARVTAANGDRKSVV